LQNKCCDGFLSALVTKQLSDPIDFHNMGVNGAKSTIWLKKK